MFSKLMRALVFVGIAALAAPTMAFAAPDPGVGGPGPHGQGAHGQGPHSQFAAKKNTKNAKMKKSTKSNKKSTGK
jgi:hypothetical protein